MDIEVVTVNLPNNLEVNFKPQEQRFDSIIKTEVWLNKEHPGWTSVCLTGLPTQSQREG